MDDEEIIRDLASDMLCRLGYEAVMAKDGDETLKLYRKALKIEKPFDLVILDLTIPGGMGGKATMEKLVEMDKDVKAVVSSGYSNDPVMSNYRSYGFRAAVKKPYLIQELSEALQSVLGL